MKKIFVSIFIIATILTPLFFVSKIRKAEAVGPTPSMTIGTPVLTQSDDGKLFGYKFNISTTYTPDNTSITVEGLRLMQIIVPARNITVVDFSSVYYSGNVLTAGVTYTFNFTLNTDPQIKKSINVTPEGIIIDINKPTITSISPLEAKVGENITITGTHLENTSAVFFGVKNADMSTVIKTNTTLTVTVPTGAIDGSITVHNPAGEAISSQKFKLAVDPQDIKPGSGTGDRGIYTLLAPIGEFKVAPKNIGDYFNLIFKIAIGLCGALAVIMIVIGGIQYMGDESIFGKTEAKSSITKAILGLLIALGAYALLNTINPDLLGGGGVHIGQVSAEIEEGEETLGIPEKTISISGNKTNACDRGVLVPATLFGSTINNGGVNKAIKSDIDALNADYAKLSENSPIKKYVKKGFSISRGFGSKCTKTKSGNWSSHAYGLSLDINGHISTNPYLPKGTPCKTDMPKEFVAFMRNHGWGWGAAFNDPMHFSKLSSEVNQTSNGTCKPL